MTVENARAALEVAAHLRAAGRIAKDMFRCSLQQSRQHEKQSLAARGNVVTRDPGSARLGRAS